MISRRRFLSSVATVAVAAMVMPSFALTAFAQSAESVDVADLMAAGPLPEKTMGDPKAPVTFVEYASLTCGHCASFHSNGFKVLKEEYIDTGKVFFVFRDFPLDPLAAAGAMLARNAQGDSYFPVVDLLFERQREWAYSDDPVTALRNLAKQFGYSPATFEATLSDQKLLDDINAVRARAADSFGVNSTPTFFINGERIRGAMAPADLKAKLDPLVSG